MKYKVVGHVKYEKKLVSYQTNDDINKIENDGDYYKVLLQGVNKPHKRTTIDISSDEMATGLFDKDEIYDIKRFLLWQWIKHIDKGEIDNETN